MLGNDMKYGQRAEDCLQLDDLVFVMQFEIVFESFPIEKLSSTSFLLEIAVEHLSSSS
jgi:hypothetical protein